MKVTKAIDQSQTADNDDVDDAKVDFSFLMSRQL